MRSNLYNLNLCALFLYLSILTRFPFEYTYVILYNNMNNKLIFLKILELNDYIKTQCVYYVKAKV